MKIISEFLLKKSLLLAVCNLIIAVLFKINNNGDAELSVIAGAVILLVFTITALYEIYTCLFINRTQKITLTAGFILLPGAMPFIYLFLLRKNIVAIK